MLVFDGGLCGEVDVVFLAVLFQQLSIAGAVAPEGPVGADRDGGETWYVGLKMLEELLGCELAKGLVEGLSNGGGDAELGELTVLLLRGGK